MEKEKVREKERMRLKVWERRGLHEWKTLLDLQQQHAFRSPFAEWNQPAHNY